MQKRLSKEQILQIPDLIKGGKTIKDIALDFACTTRTIDYKIKALRAAGIEVPNTQGPKPINLTDASSRTEN